MKRITTDERDIAPTIDKSERLIEMMRAQSIKELNDTIRSSYDPDKSSIDGDEEEDDDDSILSEHEQTKHVTFDSKPKITNISKSLVYRQGTSAVWDDQQMTDLETEMRQQLAELARNASDHEIKELNTPIMSKNPSGEENDVTMDSTNIELYVPSPKIGSHLYRDHSGHNWSDSQINVRKEQMVKQMAHLASQMSTSLNMYEINADNEVFIKEDGNNDSEDSERSALQQ